MTRPAPTGAVDLIVNGVPRTVPPGATLADLDELRDGPDGVAVALDVEVVPRRRWSTTPLRAGHRVDVVTAFAGG